MAQVGSASPNRTLVFHRDALLFYPDLLRLAMETTISELVGVNDLKTADELRKLTRMGEDKLWAPFFDKCLRPAAEKGFSRVDFSWGFLVSELKVAGNITDSSSLCYGVEACFDQHGLEDMFARRGFKLEGHADATCTISW